MSRFRTVFLSFLIILASLCIVQPAAAACSKVTVTGLSFGDIDPMAAGMVDVSATVGYTCSATVALFGSMKVCIEIGLGPDDSDINSRALTHNAVTSDHLVYNIYSDPGRTIVIGNVYGSASPPVIHRYGPYVVALLTTVEGSQTVYGRIAASNLFFQRTVGQYQSTLMVTVRISTLDALGLLSCADSNPAVVPMPVTAKVQSACKISATPLDFGSHPSNFSSNVQSTSELNSTCTKGTPYQIGLSNGLHATGNQRRMQAGNGQYINYELYQNAARTQRWGMALNTPETLVGTATGSSQKATVFGQLTPQGGLEAADYKDTVTVTITY